MVLGLRKILQFQSLGDAESSSRGVPVPLPILLLIFPRYAFHVERFTSFTFVNPSSKAFFGHVQL
jgi:hypothetical protein